MDYCGMDLAGVSSYVYVTNEKGRKLAAGAVDTTKEALERRLKPFVRRGRQGSRLEVGGSGHSNLLDRQVERVRRFFPGVGCAPRHRTDDSVG